MSAASSFSNDFRQIRVKVREGEATEGEETVAVWARYFIFSVRPVLRCFLFCYLYSTIPHLFSRILQQTGMYRVKPAQEFNTTPAQTLMGKPSPSLGYSDRMAAFYPSLKQSMGGTSNFPPGTPLRQVNSYLISDPQQVLSTLRVETLPTLTHNSVNSQSARNFSSHLSPFPRPYTSQVAESARPARLSSQKR